MGIEIKESAVSDAAFEEMKGFVSDYLAASVENEDDGGRMRWYPWHSAEYRFNHTLNVVDLAADIARREGADRVGPPDRRQQRLCAEFRPEVLGERLVDVRPDQQEVVDGAGEHAHVRRAGEGRP